MIFELDVLPGLKELAGEEWAECLGPQARLLPDPDPEAIRFEWTRRPEPVLGLRLAAAAHRLLHFEIRRPRQLLGDQAFRSLVAALQETIFGRPFTGLRISAAGARSPVFERLKAELSQALQLPIDDRDGDLLLRIRPSAVRTSGWDVLVRLTPRPLGTRAWRVANMPGALNATVAAAMVRLSRPRASDRVLNLMCGSGTLLAERAAAGQCSQLVGCDNSLEALALAAANLDRPSLVRADATGLPFGAAEFDVILADLPWGNLSGSHAANLELYPRALAEAGRVAAPEARFVLITHEVSLMRRCLAVQQQWLPRRQLSVFQGGQHPRIHVLELAA